MKFAWMILAGTLTQPVFAASDKPVGTYRTGCQQGEKTSSREAMLFVDDSVIWNHEIFENAYCEGEAKRSGAMYSVTVESQNNNVVVYKFFPLRNAEDLITDAKVQLTVGGESDLFNGCEYFDLKIIEAKIWQKGAERTLFPNELEKIHFLRFNRG